MLVLHSRSEDPSKLLVGTYTLPRTWRDGKMVCCILVLLLLQTNCKRGLIGGV